MDAGTGADASTVGWINSPNGRGTIDIVYSCCITVFLCTWSLLCLNVSARNETVWDFLRRKCWLAMLALLGPEYVLALAIGQWQSARRSVRDFKDLKLGGQEWTLKHAFYADMGGFHLKLNDMPEPFPLKAGQLHRLVEEELFDHETVRRDICIEVEDIDDKNKTDTGVRFIAVIQTLCFTITLAARAIQGLAITTMELTACGFVITTYATVFFWRQKPTDVTRANILTLNMSSRDIHVRFGAKPFETWHRTPLDFLDGPQHWLALSWFYFVQLLRRLHLVQLRKEEPLKRIPDDNFMPVCGLGAHSITMAFTTAGLAINLSAWNFYFPSEVERDLWRASALFAFGSTYAAYIHTDWLVPLYPERQKVQDWVYSLRVAQFEWVKRLLGTAEAIALRLRNITPGKDPWYDVELRAMLPGIVFAALYTISRGYMLAEDLVNFRALPLSAYDTVDWVQFLPQF